MDLCHFGLNDKDTTYRERERERPRGKAANERSHQKRSYQREVIKEKLPNDYPGSIRSPVQKNVVCKCGEYLSRMDRQTDNCSGQQQQRVASTVFMTSSWLRLSCDLMTNSILAPGACLWCCSRGLCIRTCVPRWCKHGCLLTDLRLCWLPEVRTELERNMRTLCEPILLC